MTKPSQKIEDRILGAPAPVDIEWTQFITMWKSLGAEVKEESGDRLAVDHHGHRVDFRRPHNGLVGIEDIERARHLLKTGPASTEGHGHLLVLTLTEEDARFYDFDLGQHDVETIDTEHERNPDPRGHHMRTVEKHTGKDDKQDMVRFYDELVEVIQKDHRGRRFVILGHGTGTSNTAEGFDAYLRTHHPEIGDLVIATGDIDLSAATEADIENAAKKLAGQ